MFNFYRTGYSLLLKSLRFIYPSNYRKCHVNVLAEGKTTVQFINNTVPNRMIVMSYNQLGFRLNNELFCVGPIAIFPRRVLGWNVQDHRSIDEKSLSLFYLMVPKVDVLVLGVEDQKAVVELLPIQMFLNSKGINTEILTIERALETYNFLCIEGRNVGAGLLPPEKKRKKHSSFQSLRLFNEKGDTLLGGKLHSMTDDEDNFVFNSASIEIIRFQQGNITREELRDRIKEIRMKAYKLRTDI